MADPPFQIPGLGEAKRNEQLPVENFAPDLLAAAASILGERGEIVGGTNEQEQLETREQRKQQQKEEATIEADHCMELDPSDTTTLSAHSEDHPDYQNTKMSGREPNGAAAQTGDVEMKTGNEEPPSPGVTRALEAALDGMLPKDSAPTQTEQTEASNAQQQQNGSNTEQEEEHPEWEADSSPYESSSESSSDSSDDDSEDEGGYQLLGIEETARLLMAADGDADGDGDAGKARGAGAALRTKNEMPEEVLPKPDVTITPEMKIERLGSIQFIVENTVVIKSHVPGEVQVLDSGSVLCKEDRTVIGALADILGNVRNPVYTVGFASEDEIKELGLVTDMPIYYPVDHANYVFTQPLREAKGTDASNLHDEEVAADEMEFSDDEKEAEYKRAQKMKKRGGKAGRGAREMSVASSHTMTSQPAANAGLNYDEDDDGPYKPLTRPPGFGQGAPPSFPSLPPKPEIGFSPPRGGRGHGHRGAHRGGRGDFRGRNQRGGNRGGDRRHNSRGGGGSFPQYPSDGPASPQPFSTPPPALPQNPHLPPPPFGANPPAPIGQWPVPPPPFVPHPPSFVQSPPARPQMPVPQHQPPAGNFTFNYPAWTPPQGQQYQYPPSATHHQTAAPQQQPSYAQQPYVPAQAPAWPATGSAPQVPPVAGAYGGQPYFSGYQQPQQQGQQQYWPQQQQQ
ncbi:hypothetical protein VTI74DRAFT_7938 [Chaetomium olivicolor]